MTSIVGVLCSDGVVIGSDSVATFGTGHFSTIEQRTQKIDIVGLSVIVAGTGSVGLHQRFANIVDQAYEGTLAQTLPPHLGGLVAKSPATGRVFTKANPLDVVRTLSRAGLEDMAHTYQNPGQYAALIAFPCQNKPHLCEFGISDFQPELKEDKRLWYVSLGSAQAITDPFLGFIRRAFWATGIPSVSDAIFAVTWTLQHAIELNPGGVNGPIRIAVLEKTQDKFAARLLGEDDLLEHSQNIEAAYEALRGFRDRQQEATDAPDVPTL
jgi:hypothetical protein